MKLPMKGVVCACMADGSYGGCALVFYGCMRGRELFGDRALVPFKGTRRTTEIADSTTNGAD